MIRRMENRDLDAVADIWLDTNRKAHSFISSEYWESNLEAVKEMFPQAEIYVWEEKGELQGFVGLTGDYIAGIFVRSQSQGSGIGTRLLDRAKRERKELRLHVYRKNERAVRFYQREGFQVESEDIDKNTGEAECLMRWRR